MDGLPVLIAPDHDVLDLTVGGVRRRGRKWEPSPLPPSREIMHFFPLPTAPGAGVILYERGGRSALARVDGAGRVLWELPLPGEMRVRSARMAPDGWLAVGGRWWVSPWGEIREDPALEARLLAVGPERSILLREDEDVLGLIGEVQAGQKKISLPTIFFWDGAWALVKKGLDFWAQDVLEGQRIVMSRQARSVCVLPDGTWAVAGRDGTVRTGWRGEADPRPGPGWMVVQQVLAGNLLPGGGWAFWVESYGGHHLLVWPPDGGPVRALEVPNHLEWFGKPGDPIRLLSGGAPIGQRRVWLIPAAGTERPAWIPGDAWGLWRAGPFIVARIDDRLYVVAGDGRSAREVPGLPSMADVTLIPGPTGALVVGRVGSGREKGMTAWVLSLAAGEPEVVPVVSHRPGQAVRDAVLRDGRVVLEVRNGAAVRLLLLGPDGTVEGSGTLPAGLPEVGRIPAREIPGGQAIVPDRALVLAPDGGPVIPAVPIGRPGKTGQGGGQ